MKIGLVAHDAKKEDLLEWAKFNKGTLSKQELVATGTTGGMLAEALQVPIDIMLSGPKGGDQQIGALIATKELDALIFFWDPESPQPHDPDVKALLRLATFWNIPYACNVTTADMLISSTLFDVGDEYIPVKPVVETRDVEVSEDGSVMITERVA